MLRLQKCALLIGASVIEYKRGISSAVMISNKHWSAVDWNATKWRNSFKGHCMKPEIGSSSVRSQSTRNTMPTDLLSDVHTAASDECREFMADFPDVVRDLTDAGKHLDIPEANKWFAEVLQYNMTSVKPYRGWGVALAYRMLSPADQLTPENVRLAHILGWCVEMHCSFLLGIDDIMDNSTVRDGKPCWYLHKNIGLAAINDFILLENGLYELLRRYFQDKTYYTAILELFHDNTLKFALGQYLDLSSSELSRKPYLDSFTMARYTATVKYKSGYFCYYLPVALAMHMAGIQEEEMYRQAKTISFELGHFFQVQNDFLDCFGDPEITGKIGSDIQNGRCTWPIVVALQSVTPDQRAILEECYGSNNPEHVTAVKELYKLIGVPAAFSKFEEKNYKLISTHIQHMPRKMPHKWFSTFLEITHRREYLSNSMTE